MTRIRHRACYKLHHLRVIDLAPFKWNVSLGILVEDLKTCFYSFLTFRCLYVLQNSSIALKYISKCRTSRTMNISPLRLCSREQTNGSTSTKNKMAVHSLIIGFSVHINLLFFCLEIRPFYEHTTVNTE